MTQLNYDYNQRPELKQAIYARVMQDLAQWLPAPASAGPRPLDQWEYDEWLAAEWITYWQGALPWFVQRLQQTGAYTAVPEDIYQRLLLVEADSRQRSQQMLDDALHLLSTLQDQLIPALPLKGTVLAACYYDDPLLRPFGDIDLLVDERDLNRASTVVEKLGYRFHKRTVKDKVYLIGDYQEHPWSPNNVRPLEIQHQPLNEYGGLVYKAMNHILWHALKPQTFWAGASCHLPTLPALLHHICAHTTEDWLQQKGKLMQLKDLETAVYHMTAKDWSQFLHDVEKGDGARFVFPALALSARYTAAAVPPEILSTLRTQSPAPLRHWVDTIELVDTLEMQRESHEWLDLRLAHLLIKTPRERLSVLWKLLFPPRWHFRLQPYKRLIQSPFWPLAYLLLNGARLQQVLRSRLHLHQG